MAKWTRAKASKRRAYLKRWSAEYINTGQRIDYRLWENKQENADRYRRGEVQQYDENGRIVSERYISGPNPRAIVVQNLSKKMMQGPRFQRLGEFLHVDLVNGKKQKVKLFFHGNEYFIVEENSILNIQRRSRIFNSREKLMIHWQRGILEWVETIKFPSPQ